MTLLLEEPSAAVEQEAQLLFKEAHQRRRRLRIIWVTIVSAVVAVVVLLGLAFQFWAGPASRPVGDGAPPVGPAHLRTGATLVYAFTDLRVLDADSGHSRVLPLPAPYGGSRDLAMVPVGSSLLLNRGNTAWLYAGDIDAAPLDLGPSDGVFAGPNGGEAWIWTQPCQPVLGCTNYEAPQMGAVRLVDDAGSQIGPSVALPGDSGWYPTGLAGSAGIILSQLPAYGDQSNDQELWNPLTDRVVHRFGNAQVVGTFGNLVLWESSGRQCTTRCSVHVLDLRTGTDRSVQLPSGVTPTGYASNSPEDSTIAMTGVLGDPSRIPDPQVVIVFHPSDRVARILAGSEQATDPNLGPMAISWSTNGWLFSFTVGTTDVRAWRPGETQARVLPELRLPQVSHLVNEDPSLIAR